MARRNWTIAYIDRNPLDPLNGWGWVEIPSEDVKRLGIPTYPETYTALRGNREVCYKTPNGGNLPSRGRAGSKKFSMEIGGEFIALRVQKNLTILAVCAWAKTWAGAGARVITPGNRAHEIGGNGLGQEVHFVYFVLNEDSNAVKIGRARNVEKRVACLQTSSPARLQLLKSVRVESGALAQELERSLHRQFAGIKLNGEWFKAETILMEYIRQL